MNIVHSFGMDQVLFRLNPHTFGADPVAHPVKQARAAGLRLTGDGGLAQELTRRILESTREVSDHPGHDKADPAGKNSRNSRNDVGSLPPEMWTP